MYKLKIFIMLYFYTFGLLSAAVAWLTSLLASDWGGMKLGTCWCMGMLCGNEFSIKKDFDSSGGIMKFWGVGNGKEW